MPAAKKFGAFGGVFTPSILTILGVIMYLRLPSIVGQAGLWMTLGIIALAHVISFTTGLSVASVSTDKKVKVGGTYYMLSRSLGLPIGGTLGIALFVGLSFAVSLYVIGFAESFLSYWGFELTKDAVRLTGGIVLVVVTIVTFLSTALALRFQYVILAAIVLSLVSIVLGRHDMAPAEPMFHAAETAVPFIVLFAIFFPAVTGFEAGVSMSGDLKDPKRALPRGSLAAIGVGFMVYVLMAVFFAFTVDAEALTGNPRVLLEVSLFPPLVAAGIWGATISSAFGSILGAPRILQATSLDRVAPPFFGKGYGPANEPRRAVLVAFAIAFTGVLIGELDAIARIVSMFFIAAYGFLNLSCAIESWASPDFRPSFRIPRFVSVIGALACLIVMIQLDLLAMIGATVLLGGLYLYLQRKQLALESGDTWEAFWSSIARAALHRLDRSRVHERNWRPNIILFGGPEGARPRLVELGRQLVHRRGLVSHFELVEDRTAPAPAPLDVQHTDAHPADARHTDIQHQDGRQAEDGGGDEDADDYGVFRRRIVCPDVYDGMESIARFYGYAGIEPNTVLMGWARKTRDPARFVRLLDALTELDYNVLLLDRDESRGFGGYRRIDVWWRGAGRNAGLALALVRYLSTADDWRQARVRFITVNDGAAAHSAAMHRDMAGRLDEYRVDGEVVVIDNHVQRRPFPEIVRAESGAADLTIIGIPDLRPEQADAYVSDTSRILESLRAVLLVRASSFFGPEFAGPATALAPSAPAVAASVTPAGDDVPLTIPPVAAFAAVPIRRLDGAMAAAASSFVDGHLARAYASHVEYLRELGRLVERIVTDGERIPAADPRREAIGLRRLRTELLAEAGRILARYRDAGPDAQSRDLADATTWLAQETAGALAAVQETVESAPAIAAWAADPADPLALRVYKLRKRFTAAVRRTSPRHTVPLRALATLEVGDTVRAAVAAASHRLVVDGYRVVGDGRQVVDRAREYLDARIIALDSGGDSAVVPAESVLAESESVLAAVDRLPAEAGSEARSTVRGAAKRLAERVTRIEPPGTVRRAAAREQRAVEAEVAHAAGMAERWAAAQLLVLNDAETELLLGRLRARVGELARRTRGELRHRLRDELRNRIRRLLGELGAFADRVVLDPGAAPDLEDSAWPQLDADAWTDRLLAELRKATEALPEFVELPARDALVLIEAGEPGDAEAMTVSLRRLADFRVETGLLGPLQEALGRVAPVWEQAVDAAEDAVRIARLRPETAPADAALDELDLEADRAGAVRGAETRLQESMAELERAGRELDAALAEATARVQEFLKPYAVTRASDDLSRYVRAERGREALSRARRLARAVRGFTGEQLVRLVYKRSETVLLARRLEAGTVSGGAEGVRSLVASVAPRREVMETLPFHYRQLFLGKPTLTRDYWVGWEEETRRAAAAADASARGALLVVGELGAGKTSLAHHIATEVFGGARVCRVLPPPTGSTDPQVLVDRIRAATGAGAGDDPFAGLASGSVVILDDLDLWWRRDAGFSAIDAALAWIDGLAGRYRFIVTVDDLAYRLMSRQREMDGAFVDVITCRPFSARQIGEVVRFRHDATGLSFSLRGRPEHGLSDLARARLSNALFEVSRGNIGVALQAWVAAIRSRDGDWLDIEPPVAPELRALDALEPLKKLLLIELMLHRGCSQEHLLRSTALPSAALERELGVLKRYGLVVERANGWLGIDRYVRPHLLRYLEEAGLV